jgi:hypothetical protein
VNAAIAAERLVNQRIVGPARRRPEEVVEWLGAVQAQEYPFARWALGLRMSDAATDAQVTRAIDDGRILRTHVMRPTWHFVTAADIGWMLELTAPRVHRIVAVYKRNAKLDEPTCTRAAAIFENALGDGRHLTRAELGAHLARAGIVVKGVRLAVLTIHAELEGIVCSGARREGQLTYALLADRAPRGRRLSRDEALAELTHRYFRSHGPATIRDFVWWSGLTTTDAKRGLEINRARQHEIDGLTYWSLPGRATADARRTAAVHLLPVYDEYLVAYRDRAAVPHAAASTRSSSGGMSFQHALVIDGQVAGTWRAARRGSEPTVEVRPLKRLTRTELRGLDDAIARYGRFLGSPVSLSIE